MTIATNLLSEEQTWNSGGIVGLSSRLEPPAIDVRQCRGNARLAPTSLRKIFAHSSRRPELRYPR
jgi:hypothetical protein